MTVAERILATLRREDDFLCALASIALDGTPRVRFMKGVIDDDLVIRCPTFASTQKVQDIQGVPTSHLLVETWTPVDLDRTSESPHERVSAKISKIELQCGRLG